MLFPSPVQKNCCLAFLLSLSACGDNTDPSAFAWGAQQPDERYYPNTDWTSNFSDQADVEALVDIEGAINRCDDVVGVTGYCVVSIQDGAMRAPISLNRSRTKLIGFEGMVPLSAHNNTSAISVESNVQHVVIQGLDLAGHDAGEQEIFGIMVSGENIRGVVMQDNAIHHFESSSNAHGIAVDGNGATNETRIQDVLIENNSIQQMKTGSSEIIVINGNVAHWAVVGNRISDVNNIAIDVIGSEGTAPTQTLADGRVVPGDLDRARYGFIRSNRVENFSTLNNPACDNQPFWAAAIYVDGAVYVEISDNRVINAPWAYEVGAENCVTTSHVVLEGNSAETSYYGDLLLGGYAETGFDQDSTINCDPASSVDVDEGHGYVSNLTAKANSFQTIGTQEGKILPQYRLRAAVILDSGVTADNSHLNGEAPGDENAILTQDP